VIGSILACCVCPSFAEGVGIEEGLTKRHHVVSGVFNTWLNSLTNVRTPLSLNSILDKADEQMPSES